MPRSRNDQLLYDFGKRLKKFRKAKYPSAQQFAFAIGIEPHTYRHWERGEVFPNPDAIMRICGALGITANDLMPETVEAAQRAS